MGRKRGFPPLRRLPPEGLDYVHACFRQALVGAGQPYREIVAAVRKRWGVAVHERMLSRYYAYWRSDLYPIEQAEEQALGMVETLKQTPTEDIERAIRQLLTAQRLLALRGLDGADPVDVALLGVKHDRVELGREKLQVEREKMALAERRLQAFEAKLRAADGQVAEMGKRRNLDPDTLREIREIYGLGGDN